MTLELDQIAEVFFQKYIQPPNWKTDHIVVISVNPFYKQSSHVVLDPIRSCFVQRRASFDVVRNFSFTQTPEGNLGRLDLGNFSIRIRVNQSYSSIHSMGRRIQLAKHCGGLYGSTRFTENESSVYYNRVCTQDQRTGFPAHNRRSFFERQTFDQSSGSVDGFSSFIHVGRDTIKGYSHLTKKFSPSWRLGCQNKISINTHWGECQAKFNVLGSAYVQLIPKNSTID